MKIFGAGLAGLLAGCMFQDADILEAGPSSQAEHKAVLRFRSSAVGDAVGIDFRKVRVYKGVWFAGKGVEPTIQMANWYSQKVIGKLADRSIWSLDPADRFIAPENLLTQLAEKCRGRVHWTTPVTAADVDPERLSAGEVIVSTLPMPVVAKMIGRPIAKTEPEFKSSPIAVRRYRLKSSDVFQTIYYPDPEKAVYRASITGDLLVVEYSDSHPSVALELASDFEQQSVMNAFGLQLDECTKIETTSQRFGKIAPINDQWRKQFIFELTSKHNIFSLGRFGTWRNILLDDVIHDISVLKKLMNVSTYDRARHSAG